MDIKSINSALLSLEMSTYPAFGRAASTKAITINGFTVRATSRMNYGRSGKGFTTLFYINGDRVAKAKLVDVLTNKVK